MASYLGLDILKTGRRGQRKTNNKNVRAGVTQGTERVVFVRTCRIPQTEVDRLPVDDGVGRVVIKDGGHISIETLHYQSRFPHSRVGPHLLSRERVGGI